MGTQFKGPLRGSRAPGAWGYHQTRGHQNIITSLTLPFCNVECFIVSTVCAVACVVSTVCSIVFCMYIHCNHCMHCCVYSQGGIGNRRKQLEKENKCARATWLLQPPPLCSILYRQTTSIMLFYVLYYTGTTSTSIMFYANVFHQQ